MKLQFFIPAFIWAIIVLILTLTPGQFLPKVNYWSINSLDKYVHFLIFFIQVFFLFWGARKQSKPLTRNTIVVYLVIGVLFGSLIEIIQTLIPHRSCEFNDLIANTIGCLLGAGFFYIYNRLFLKPKNIFI